VKKTANNNVKCNYMQFSVQFGYRGFQAVRGQKWGFPSTLAVALTTGVLPVITVLVIIIVVVVGDEEECT